VLALADLAGRVLITGFLAWLTVGLLVALKRGAPTGAPTLHTLVKMLILAAAMAFFSSFIWLFSFSSLSATLREELYGSVVGDDVQTHESPRLARVASLLAGRRTAVSCFSREDWRAPEIERRAKGRDLRGYVIFQWPAAVVHLSPQVCADLNPLLSRSVAVNGTRSLELLARSINTLAHESAHVSGVYDEAKAECFGIQTIRRTTMLLGRTSGEGQHVATYYWENLYPSRRPRYWSPECRNGGRLDRHRNTSLWP
jgi:hypothetical protein